MIEINLIPDVKLELLRTQRQRRNVISLSILVAIVAGALVALLAVYVFVVQTVAIGFTDNAIDTQYKDLQKVQDLSKTLTIQKQLEEVSSLHSEKRLSSRVFDIMSTVVPTGTNKVSLSNFELDAEKNTITIEGEAMNGYEALEVFKKTISKTTFEYVKNGKKQAPLLIASDITDGDQRYGESNDGTRVLRFSLSFTYPAALFAPTSEQGRIIAPNKQNATDSAVGVPSSLFTNGDSGGIE